MSIDDGVRVWRGFNLLVRGTQNLVLGYFQADGAVSPKFLLKVEYTSSIARMNEFGVFCLE